MHIPWPDYYEGTCRYTLQDPAPAVNAFLAQLHYQGHEREFRTVRFAIRPLFVLLLCVSEPRLLSYPSRLPFPVPARSIP